jgi:hypothetical protein
MCINNDGPLVNLLIGLTGKNATTINKKEGEGVSHAILFDA